jgi:hypothetical protein
MTYHQTPPPPAAIERAAQLARRADAELALGRHRQAEHLAHRAARFRTLSVMSPRCALSAFVDAATGREAGGDDA